MRLLGLCVGLLLTLAGCATLLAPDLPIEPVGHGWKPWNNPRDGHPANDDFGQVRT